MKFAVSMMASSLLLVSASANADSSSTGLTGLGEMRTPEVIPDSGSQVTFIPGRYSRFEHNGGIESRVTPSVGLTHGWGESLEGGIQIPMSIHEKDSGMGNIALSAKGKLPWQLGRFDVAGSAGVEIPTASRSTQYGSGNPGFGADALASMDLGPLLLAGSVGYGTSDYCPRCTFPGAQLSEPKSIPVIRGAAGGSFGFKRFIAFAEIHGSKANNGDPGGEFSGDPDLYAIAGARLPLPKRFGITGYIGTGLHAESTTSVVGAVMLHYSFKTGLGTQARRP